MVTDDRMKLCAFCAYQSDEPEFGEHVRAVHGFIPQAIVPPPGLLDRVPALTGPQFLALGFVLLFIFGIGWVTDSYFVNFMWYGPSMNIIQVLAFLCLPLGLVCLGSGSMLMFEGLTRGRTGRDENGQGDSRRDL